MATIARTAKSGGGTNFNSGQTIDPDEVNTDFNTVYTEINGNLDDGNIETATIPGAKSLRFTEISDPSAPTSNDALLYASDEGTLTTLTFRDSASPIGSIPYYIRDAAEATTATGSAVDLKTITVNIPVTASFRLSFSFRKTSGAAAAPLLGLKINTTQVYNNTAAFSATNQAENGSAQFTDGSLITARSSALYLRPGARLGTANAVGTVNTAIAAVLDFPNATITALTITGSSVSSSVTLAVANVLVEVYP